MNKAIISVVQRAYAIKGEGLVISPFFNFLNVFVTERKVIRESKIKITPMTIAQTPMLTSPQMYL